MGSAPELPLDNTRLMTGPIIIGVSLNWWLYGILVVQYILYLTNDKKDNKILRALVHFLFLVDTAQTFMIMDDMFFWFVYNYGDRSKLFEYNLATISGPYLDCVIAFTVQLVYCWRLWVLGSGWVLPVILSLLALVSCISGFTMGKVHDVAGAGQGSFKSKLGIWLFSSAFTDILIAGFMTYLLMQYRTKSANKTTRALVTRVVVLVLETNSLTAALAIGNIFTFYLPPIAPPKTTLFMTFGYVLGKTYSNCFMMLLNQRGSYSEASNGTTVDGTAILASLNGNHSSSEGRAQGEISVIQFAEQRPREEPVMVELSDFCGKKENQNSSICGSSKPM